MSKRWVLSLNIPDLNLFFSVPNGRDVRRQGGIGWKVQIREEQEKRARDGKSTLWVQLIQICREMFRLSHLAQVYRVKYLCSCENSEKESYAITQVFFLSFASTILKF